MQREKIVVSNEGGLLEDAILSFIEPGSSVLDVGSGIAHYTIALAKRAGRLTLLDAHQPYLDRTLAVLVNVRRSDGSPIAVSSRCGDASVIFKGCVRQARADVLGDLPPYDYALAIDVIEHMPPEDGRAVIEGMKVIASGVALFIPEGAHPQHADPYGMGGDHWQTHRSTWFAKDLEALGFTVERWLGFHRNAGHGKEPNALWATWRR